MFIFVVGNSRTGTTIMARVLGRSDSIHTLNELHFFEEQWSPSERAVNPSGGDWEEILARLLNTARNDYIGERNSRLYYQEARSILNGVEGQISSALEVYRLFLLNEARINNKRVSCEQTPRNVFYLSEILEFFPNAKIINMIRDPRAVLLSQKNRWKIRSLGANEFPWREVLRSWANYHPVLTALLWNSSMNAARAVKSDAHLLSVHYERFVSEPELVLREVCDFLQVPFDSSMLQVKRSEGGVSSFGRRDVGEVVGIDREAASRWSKGGLASAEILICQAITKHHMWLNQYSQIRISWIRNLPVLIYYFVGLPFKIVVAFLFNFGRHRGVVSSIRRRLSFTR